MDLRLTMWQQRRTDLSPFHRAILGLDALLSPVVFNRQGFATPQAGKDSKDDLSVLL